jgi:hypothetical protein
MRGRSSLLVALLSCRATTPHTPSTPARTAERESHLRAAVRDASTADAYAAVSAPAAVVNVTRLAPWATRCRAPMVALTTRTTAWRPARDTGFSRTHQWLAARALIANDGLAYIEATVRSFVRGSQRVRGWRVDVPYFSARAGLLTWAGVVLPIEREHGPADVRSDARAPLAGREHPGFDGERDLAPRPDAPITEGLLLRAGLRREHESSLRPMFERAARAAQRERLGAVATHDADAWQRVWEGNYLASTLRTVAVYAHAHGDHEAAAQYLRSLAAICAELVVLEIGSGYGPNPAATCASVPALLADNEERIACRARDASGDDAAIATLSALDGARWPQAQDVEGRDLARSAEAEALVRSVRVDQLLFAYQFDSRLSRTVFSELGRHHPAPVDILPVRRLAYAALVRHFGEDCELALAPPDGSIRGDARHRALCGGRWHTNELLRMGW